MAITGDHSTPVSMKGHSWHAQPVVLHSAVSGSDKPERFTETGANLGSLGVMEAKYLIRLMPANASIFYTFVALPGDAPISPPAFFARMNRA